MKDDPGIETALVERALAGNREAQRRLIDELTPAIRASVARALRRLCPRRDARHEEEDITQCVLLHLFEDGGRALLQWDPARGLGLRRFAALVARCKTVAILRNRRRNPWTEDPADFETLDRYAALAVGPESEAIAREMLDLVTDRVRARLTAQAVEMFELLFLDGLAATEVCVRTEMRPERVHEWRCRLSRAAREIAVELGGDSRACT
jgi:hypothetical protein